MKAQDLKGKSRDELSDLDSRHGLVDDARIVNQVCEQLGLPELVVRIG